MVSKPFLWVLSTAKIYLPGRALASVPRQMVPTGYVDIQHDEPKEGSILNIFDADLSTTFYVIRMLQSLSSSLYGKYQKYNLI
jgi:hypothetical protein